MNPEDLLRELRDPANWNAKPTKRTDAVTAHRRISPFAVTVATIAAVAVIGVIVFSIFGAGIRSVRPASPPALPTQSASPTATSTATPTSTPTSDAASSTLAPGAKPAPLFGGDCSAVMTDAEASAFEGGPMKLVSAASVVSDLGSAAGNVFALEQAGGIECQWATPGSQNSTDNEIILALLPESTVKPLAAEVTCGEGYSEGLYGPGTCTIEHVTNDIRVSGGVQTKTNKPAVAKKLSTDVLALIDQRAATVSAPTAPVPAAGSWTNPVDCVALDKKIDADALFGGDYTVDPSGHSENGPIKAVFDLLNESQSLDCNWFPKTGSDLVTIGVQGGGGWAQSMVAALPGATKVTIVGTDAAYVVSTSSSVHVLHVFTGGNWFELMGTSNDFSSRYPAVKAIIAALNGKSGAATASSAASVITTTGWGDLKLGKPVPASTRLVRWRTVDPDTCAGHPGYWDLPNDPGAVEVRTKGNSRTGAIQLISLLDPTVKTKSGAHVGMSLAELKKLFPKATVSSDGRLYAVSDSLGQVIFDVGRKNADEYYPGPAEKKVVLLIHVLPPSMTPFSNQNTEFGSCA